MEIQTLNSNDSKEHIQYVEKHITDLRNLCYAEIKLVSDAKAKALLETSADVFNGLEKAFSDYQSENEGAWVNDVNRPNLV